VLSDAEKRKKYDQYGENWQHGAEYEQARQQQQSRGQGSGGFGGGSSYDFEGFGSDDFSELNTVDRILMRNCASV
jgi:curved DNA-binding protein